ncbi:hypothetical protein Hanom_Chr09g00771091 [Helianthus anomalus]
MFEHVETEARVQKPIMQQTSPIWIVRTTPTTGEPIDDIHEKGRVETQNVEGKGTGGSSVGGRKDIQPKTPTREPSPIRPEDILGDIYYKSCDESRTNDIHTPIWKIRHGDTFADFQPCREWFMRAFAQGSGLWGPSPR